MIRVRFPSGVQNGVNFQKLALFVAAHFRVYGEICSGLWFKCGSKSETAKKGVSHILNYQAI